MTWLRHWRQYREPADLKGALTVFLGEIAGFSRAPDPQAVATQVLDEFAGVRCDRLSAAQIVQRIQELSTPDRCGAPCESSVAFVPIEGYIDIPEDLCCTREQGHTGNHVASTMHDGYPAKVQW